MRDKDRKYSNKDIEVFWKPEKCVHASTCYNELIAVFNPSCRPWVNLEAAPTEKIIEVVNKCPTEALMWRWIKESRNREVTEADTNHIEIRKSETYRELMLDEDQSKSEKPLNVKIMRDGPVVIEGEFKVITSKGEELKTGNFISFCRCGQSNSMPFCDGMHRKIAFSD